MASITIFILSISIFAFSFVVDAQHRPFRPLIPNHESATSSAGTVQVSGRYSALYAGWNAVRDDQKFWISKENQAPAWLTYQFSGTPRLVVGYRILFANGPSLTSRAPKTFSFQVLRGSTWETVDHRCCETNWGGYEERPFYLSQPVTGKKFRLYIEQDNDSRSSIVVISIRRFQIL